MTTAPDRCPNDLFARAQRGPISVVERRALDAHLGVCDLCRATQALATLYQGLPDSAAPGEEALVARLADRALDRAFHAEPRHRHGRRYLALAAAAVLLIAAGGAAAWVSTRHAVEPAAPPTAVPSAPPSPLAGETAPAAFGMGAADEPPLPQAPPPSLAPPDALHRVRAPSARRSTTGQHPSRPTASAADLFAAANAARRDHDLSLAIHRYESLQREFPQSMEARVSHISAGDLLVRLGRPGAALTQFEHYLRSEPTGSLAPEALFRSATCLQMLGRHAEEREVWRSLLRRFPASIYEQVARQRLDERDR